MQRRARLEAFRDFLSLAVLNLLSMGSFTWDDSCHVQYHNGRPLSVALTEPCQCDGDDATCFPSDFTTMRYRPRSQSSGRRFQRESYSVYRPNVQYTSFCYSPPFSRRMMDHSASRDMFVEKLETVTIEEQQCRPRRCCTPALPVRQVKIRPRPSSCFDLHKKEANDNQWTKIVDERTEEHYDWHYNITLPLDRTSTIQRDSSSTFFGHHESGTRTNDDLRIPITSKPVRTSTRDVGTITDGLPKKPIRPLSISETQVLDRYEKNEKIRRDSITETGSTSFVISQRPLQRSSEDDDDDDENYDLHGRQAKRANKRAQRREFFQRMHARNGTTARSYNALNIYSDRGRNQMIVRPTAKPREALVDAPAIVAPPSESELPRPITIEKTTYRSRNYFEPI